MSSNNLSPANKKLVKKSLAKNAGFKDRMEYMFQDQVKPKLAQASVEGAQILEALGFRWSSNLSFKEPKKSFSEIKEVLADFVHSNPTPAVFFKNLDVATYDSREKLKWNTKMLCAYAGNQAVSHMEKWQPKLTQPLKKWVPERFKQPA
ncbi:MAG: hypothetical protein V4629_02695 [Pseudomonadota bacterium]